MSGLPRDRGQFGLSAVSHQDIQAFRTSITARRFPALREMRDEDIAALVVANKKVQARRSRQPDPYGADALTAYQVESDAALPTVDNTQTTRFAISQTKAVFRPCNPMEAKQDIALEGQGLFLASSLPYEEPKTRLEMRKEAKPFVPSSSVVSREGIAVKAYLNSPDAETLAQEKEFIARRASSNLKAMLTAGYGRVPKPKEEVVRALGEAIHDLMPGVVEVQPMSDLNAVADEPAAAQPPTTPPTDTPPAAAEEAAAIEPATEEEATAAAVE